MRNRKRNFFSSIMTVHIMLLAASFLFPGQRQAQAQDRSFVPLTLAAATDLHYIAPELTDGGECFTRLVENADGKAMAYCEEITDAFVSQVTGEKPDALILTGDLTFNGAKASHEALAAKLSSIENAGIPVLVIPGNHDLNSTMAASFQGRSYTLVDSVDAGQFAEIYGDFGYREALARDKASLSYVYELSPGLRILMLDVNTKEAPGTLTDDTFRWVREQLKAARQAGDLVLAASHQTLLTHNRLFSDGYVIGNGSRLLELYEEYGVLCNLSGHIHIQHHILSPVGIPIDLSPILPQILIRGSPICGCLLPQTPLALIFPHKVDIVDNGISHQLRVSEVIYVAIHLWIDNALIAHCPHLAFREQ